MSASQDITGSLIRLLRFSRSLKWQKNTEQLIYNNLIGLLTPPSSKSSQLPVLATPAPSQYPPHPPQSTLLKRHTLGGSSTPSSQLSPSYSTPPSTHSTPSLSEVTSPLSSPTPLPYPNPRHTASTTTAPTTTALKAPQSYTYALKKLIDDGASWRDIFELLRRWWAASPHPDLACKIIELSYIWAGPEGVEEALVWFQDFEFWPRLHKAIRKHILLYTHKKPASKPICAYLYSQAFAPWLTPTEKLMVFCYATAQRDYALVFRFHNKYTRELTDHLKKLSGTFSMSFGEFQYCAALARKDQGHSSGALSLLQTILPSDSYYQPACKLKRTIQTQKKSPAHAHLHSKIVGEVVMKSQWEERESTLRHYFEKIRQEPCHGDIMISVLNDLLTQKNIIPMDRPGMLSRYVGMCIEFYDLYPYIPNILMILSNNACVFHPPPVDGAIWNHFLGSDIPDFPLTPWKAVALFHRFMMIGPEVSDALKLSYELMSTPGEGSEYIMDLDFTALKKAGYAWLRDNPLHDATTTRIMEAYLSLCTDDITLNGSQIASYLKIVPHPPLNTLKRLLKVSRDKKDSSLTYKVLHSLVQNGYLRTSDLKRYLGYVIQDQKPDLAWRTLTILKSRKSSIPSLESIWQVSGENRQRYHLSQATSGDLRKYLNVGYSAEARQIWEALLICGYRIPELMAIASYRHQTARWKNPPGSSIEEVILLGFEDYEWLKKPPRRVSEDDLHPYAPQSIPESSSWAINPYTVCAAYLFEFLGLSVINGDLFRLSPLLPLTTNPDAPRSSTRNSTWNTGNPTKKMCYRWFRSLSDDERLAWLDLTSVLQKKPSHLLNQQVSFMVLRLALMLLPAHHEALHSLRLLQMPLVYIRDLEGFILSEGYSQYRRHSHLATKVPVPSYPSLHKHLQS